MRICGRAAGVTTMCLVVTLLGAACGTQSGSSTSSTPAAHRAPASNPVRVIPASRRVGSGGVDFLAYDAPVSITVPAGALDFSHLHG
jgi:hypothetical protein